MATSSNVRGFGQRDLKIAVLVALGVEAALSVWGYFVLIGWQDHFWLRATQLPGSLIVQWVFRDSGTAMIAVKLAVSALIQSFIFAALALAILYVFRIIKTPTQMAT